MDKKCILVEGERQDVENKINELAQQGYELRSIAVTRARDGSIRRTNTVVAAMWLLGDR